MDNKAEKAERRGEDPGPAAERQSGVICFCFFFSVVLYVFLLCAVVINSFSDTWFANVFLLFVVVFSLC